MTTYQPASQGIDDYIVSAPPEVQPILQKIRLTIRQAAPQAAETIKYKIPTFVLNGNLIVSYAAYKRHIGVYPRPAGTQKFQKALAVYKAAKSTAHFPLDEPIPYDLIGQLVKYRVKETSAGAKTSKKQASE